MKKLYIGVIFFFFFILQCIFWITCSDFSFRTRDKHSYLLSNARTNATCRPQESVLLLMYHQWLKQLESPATSHLQFPHHHSSHRSRRPQHSCCFSMSTCLQMGTSGLQPPVRALGRSPLPSPGKGREEKNVRM